jgi:two-component system, chemotaxis family, protein-glutamate methylesterase/glutaminase
VGRIRVLLVDDSAVVRRMVRGALDSDPDIEVVAEAANGQEAMLRLRESEPDAVVCDVEMPVMSGIETVQAIRRLSKNLPVVMFASPNQAGAHVTLEALHAGASDFVTKPTAAAGTAMAAVMEGLCIELGGKIKGLLRGPGDLSAVARAAIRYAPPPVPEVEVPAPPPSAAPTLRNDEPAQPAPRPRPPSAAPLPSADLSHCLPAARAAVRPAEVRTVARPRQDAGRPLQPHRPRSGRCEAVLIGISTGGPNALAELIPRLPADLPVPVLVVQHMPPVFTRLLAERLASKAQMPVREAAHGDPVRAGEVLLAPGDFHLLVRREGAGVACALNHEAAENSVRPAVDVLFRSAAEVWGGNVLVVIMTGMGQDGLLGAVQLHGLGAPVLAQDEASSVVWGMPGAVVKAGIADRVLPLSQLADEIALRARGMR